MAAVIELTRDKDGFLKCKDCPRRFLTELMFENHLCNQHKKETEMKLNQIKYSPTIKVEISFPNNTQSEEECSLSNLSFGSQVEFKLQSIEHQKVNSIPMQRVQEIFWAKVTNYKPHELCSQQFKSTSMARLKKQKYVLSHYVFIPILLNFTKQCRKLKIRKKLISNGFCYSFILQPC